MAKNNLFYGTYFNAEKLEMTVLVWRYDFESGVDFMAKCEPCFVRTVNLRTDVETTECTADCTPQMFYWLSLHFAKEYVVSDGKAMLMEYMQGASDWLAVHEKYGQNTFHADLEELYYDDQYIEVSELMARQ